MTYREAYCISLQRLGCPAETAERACDYADMNSPSSVHLMRQEIEPGCEEEAIIEFAADNQRMLAMTDEEFAADVAETEQRVNEDAERN